MSNVIVRAFSVSLDGFGAGPRQDLQNPLGVRGSEIFQWFFDTDVFKTIQGQGTGSKGIDNDFALKSFENVGAWILGRNMFGPIRGPWKDDAWKGWWGEEPPIRQYLTAGHIDDMHLAMSPVLMGEGEPLFSDINLPQLGFTSIQAVTGENATHLLIKKRGTVSDTGNV